MKIFVYKILHEAHREATKDTKTKLMEPRNVILSVSATITTEGIHQYFVDPETSSG